MTAFLFDLDGVIYNGNKPIKDATGTISWIKEQGFPYMFITNTTSLPRSSIAKKLSIMGIQADISQILTPSIAAVKWLKENISGPIALFSADAVKEEYKEFEMIPDSSERGAAAVIIGDMGEKWDFFQLNRAFRLLVSEPRPYLLALGMTRFWMASDGLRLDTAPFVAALEKASNVNPIVFGKPEKDFFQSATDFLNVPVEQSWMVGDDIISDIQGAQNAGLRGILVRTGKYNEQDLNQGIIPDVILDSIADLPRWWERR